MVNPYIYKRRKQQYIRTAAKQYGVGAGFVIHHKNKRIHAESIHMPDTSTVLQAEIEAISTQNFFMNHQKKTNQNMY